LPPALYRFYPASRSANALRKNASLGFAQRSSACSSIGAIFPSQRRGLMAHHDTGQLGYLRDRLSRSAEALQAEQVGSGSFYRSCTNRQPTIYGLHDEAPRWLLHVRKQGTKVERFGYGICSSGQNREQNFVKFCAAGTPNAPVRCSLLH
jgi:hypothetical protein